MDEEEPLEKIWAGQRIDGEIHGEAMWARPLGDNLFELRNSPFFLYGLNFLDVVRCGTAPGRKPFALYLAKRAGHRTLRVWFTDECTAGQREALIDSLASFGLTYEGYSKRLLIYDIPPKIDMEPIDALVLEEQRLGHIELENVSDEAAEFVLPEEIPADHGEPGIQSLTLE